jgi:hypothetical protein
MLMTARTRRGKREAWTNAMVALTAPDQERVVDIVAAERVLQALSLAVDEILGQDWSYVFAVVLLVRVDQLGKSQRRRTTLRERALRSNSSQAAMQKDDRGVQFAAADNCEILNGQPAELEGRGTNQLPIRLDGDTEAFRSPPEP